jgi:hypothetical protein
MYRRHLDWGNGQMTERPQRPTSSALDRFQLAVNPKTSQEAPASVRERDSVYGKPLPLGCYLTGDPPPGRSALDQKRRIAAAIEPAKQTSAPGSEKAPARRPS